MGVIEIEYELNKISYFISNKKNNNDKEPGLILTGKGIEKCVMDKNVSLK